MSEEWRGSKGAREGNVKGGILRRALPSIQYIHKPSHNVALAIDTLLLQMKNCEQVYTLCIVCQVDDMILCDGNYGLGAYD